MPFNVNSIRAQLTGGGARPNLFNVRVPFPAISDPQGAVTHMTFLCKGAQIPGSDIGTIEVPYFGRVIKIAGNRTFAEWTTTVINDEDFVIYNAIQEWMNQINSHQANFRTAAAGNAPLGYQVDSEVFQYAKTGEEIKKITIVNMWPSSLAPIDLAWETNDAVEEFTCTWQYDYWKTPTIDEQAA